MTRPASAFAAMWRSAGSPKASVFPEPVAAIPMRSLPERMIGQHWDWMGEGVVNADVHFSWSSEKPVGIQELDLGLNFGSKYTDSKL